MPAAIQDILYLSLFLSINDNGIKGGFEHFPSIRSSEAVVSLTT